MFPEKKRVLSVVPPYVRSSLASVSLVLMVYQARGPTPLTAATESCPETAT